MTPELINWFLLVFFIVQIAVIALWRWNKFPRFIFNVWAVFLYSALIPATFMLGAWLNLLLIPASPSPSSHRSTLIGLALIGAIASFIILGLTLVLRWAANTTLNEPPGE